MDNVKLNQRLETLFQRFPLLLPTLQKLNNADIPYMIGGSGVLYLYGNERLPDDVDIFLLASDHDKTDKIFGITSYTYVSPLENVRNSNPQGDHSVQLTSNLKITRDGRTYDLNPTATLLSRRGLGQYKGEDVHLMPPEEPLLIKAILRRGVEVKKNDLEDIQNFLKIYPDIDRIYLKKRWEELHLPQDAWSF